MGICSVATCEKVSVARGFCINHYQKWKKYGDAETTKQVQFHGLTVKERFFKYVKKTDGCWLWIGGLVNGYGQIRVNGKPELAHRVSWQLNNGDVPEGKYVLHKCDVPRCVNPEHLYVGDQYDNMDDMWSRGRAKPGHVCGETHGCSKLTEELVKMIRNSDLSPKELCNQLNLSHTTISDVKLKKTWKHV